MPESSRPMPIGQVTGAHWMPSTRSISSSRSTGGAPVAVELVDEGHDRRVAQAADFHQLDRAFLDALGAVDDHQRRVDRGQRPVGVLGEVLVARRVEQVDDAPAIRELHDRRRDRDAALLLEAHPVRGRMARRLASLDRAGHLDRAAEQQQLLGQRGLAGVRVRDDREAAAAVDFVVRRHVWHRAGRAIVAGSSASVEGVQGSCRARDGKPARPHGRPAPGSSRAASRRTRNRARDRA